MRGVERSFLLSLLSHFIIKGMDIAVNFRIVVASGGGE
jgi:hypothetical protein